MTQQLIENLNNLVLKCEEEEIIFSCSLKVGKEEVLGIGKNKVWVGGRYKFPLAVDFEDFIMVNGIGSLFQIYEVASTKVPDHTREEVKMDYNCLLHYNPITKKYAYLNRDDVKYYFGAGKGSEGKKFKVGYGVTQQEAIKNYNKQL